MNVLAVPPWRAALSGLCPRCGKPTLFAGLLKFAPACTACALDFGRFNVGDGASVFLTFIVGTIIVVGAIALELGALPPWWVHVLVWPPLALALVIATTRFAKGLLLALEYRNDAGVGRAK